MTAHAERLARALLLTAVVAGCGGGGTGEPVRIVVAPGAAFSHVADSLAAHQIVDKPLLFGIYARLSGATGDIKPGSYEFRPHTDWRTVLADLRNGDVLTEQLLIPEGLDLRAIAQRLAELSGVDEDSALAALLDSAAADRYGVPGPTMEGYLFPSTYTFPLDPPLETAIHHLVDTYMAIWTPERRARAEALGMSEREVTTLASIVEKEAMRAGEMPLISSVYHNRLRIGYPLQADPTVLYALGGHRERLLYAAIDSVADHPYNTYAHAGLPPGPIASPGERAIDAALSPAQTGFLYFVARPDGTHVFTRSLEDHNRARAAIRSGRDGGSAAGG